MTRNPNLHPLFQDIFEQMFPVKTVQPLQLFDIYGRPIKKTTKRVPVEPDEDEIDRAGQYADEKYDERNCHE